MSEKKPSIVEIQRIVARHFQMTVDELIGSRRNERLLWPRHIAIYLSQKLTGESAAVIGNAFRRSHPTVVRSCQVVENRISIYPKEAAILQDIEKKIKKNLTKNENAVS